MNLKKYTKETVFTVLVFILGFLCGYFLTNIDSPISSHTQVSILEIFNNNISIIYLNIAFGIITAGIYSNINLFFQGIGMGAVIKVAVINDMGIGKLLSSVIAHGFLELIAFFVANILVILIVKKIYNIILDKQQVGRLLLLKKLITNSTKVIIVVTTITLLAAIIEGTITEKLYNSI
ncbi:stage II sporulation protein M [Bacillus sp. 1NLA3E]|uniref:stage II sporulation protein M n=1 Tax=Bacillus sp. 1NLA3E TaxID=666686 RepID=UPI000247E47D|nr:stage II sporulation protein M [Bacillus sp. 1NLA3E]AGK55973.1 hypothetical protein B1NLA3E_21175 [Bacillus sp. 1NLA3E]